MTQEQALLQRCSIEIKTLRRSNELMEARLSMFDKIIMVLHTRPEYPGMGMSPDVCFEIDKYFSDAV